jgi:hypothetical protein
MIFIRENLTLDRQYSLCAVMEAAAHRFATSSWRPASQHGGSTPGMPAETEQRSEVSNAAHGFKTRHPRSASFGGVRDEQSDLTNGAHLPPQVGGQYVGGRK